MNPLILAVPFNGTDYTVDLSEGICIAIALDHTASQPNAYHAPPYEASPHQVGNWTGDTREGGSVNFYDVKINPHGNGTHTECVGHISKERIYIHDSLGAGKWIAQLISVYPVKYPDGDRVIDELEWVPGINAIILRTLPNHPDKMARQYSGTNPPYVKAEIVKKMADAGIQHLLLDLPSVDREEDGGVLAAHKAFWNYPENPRMRATISEMVYVDNVIPDGLYLLEIQLPAIMLDASPSRPFIYAMK